ncbi:MAG: MFS transporter, partial [Proteobacteria bacterium]|nr:MFS transporter [Pseudomonadota bacterium]
ILPLGLLALLPLPPTERRGLRESFLRLLRDIADLLRAPYVLRCLLLFATPCATFALTNMFGGIGADFHASEPLVAAVSGVGVTLTVLATAPLTGRLLANLPPAPFYLLTGVAGAGFTLALLLLPHSPAVLVVAVVGENVFQTAAFTCASTIIFRSIGRDSPLAATQFALLYGAMSVPLAYMQALDGRGYGAAGLPGALLTDAGISLAACALLAVPVLRWHRRRGFEPAA